MKAYNRFCIVGLIYKTFKDRVTKIRSIALTNDETEPNEYLAILPCIPCENSHPQKINVELDDDKGQSAIGSFKFVEDKEQAIKDFGIHVGYIRLINNRCDPWRLDKGGVTRILVKSHAEDNPYGGDILPADFGNDAIPCMCKNCSRGDNNKYSSADGTTNAEVVEKADASVIGAFPPKKRIIEGFAKRQ